MASNLFKKLLDFANMQMAAEAFLVEGAETAPPAADVSRRLIRGNTHASTFTPVQAQQFISEYKVVAQYRNEPLKGDGARFSATLFEKISPRSSIVTR